MEVPLSRKPPFPLPVTFPIHVLLSLFFHERIRSSPFEKFPPRNLSNDHIDSPPGEHYLRPVMDIADVGYYPVRSFVIRIAVMPLTTRGAPTTALQPARWPDHSSQNGLVNFLLERLSQSSAFETPCNPHGTA